MYGIRSVADPHCSCVISNGLVICTVLTDEGDDRIRYMKRLITEIHEMDKEWM